ncbi:MAG: SGNH family hydrolase [Pseudomonadota bacterium]
MSRRGNNAGDNAGVLRLAIVLVLALATLPASQLFVPASLKSVAFAQEQQPQGLFGRLFRNRQNAQPQRNDGVKVRRTKPKAKVIRVKPRTTKRRTGTTKRRAAAPVVAPAINKDDDAKTVAVVGDFLASGLARGLTSHYAESPKVYIRGHGMPSSGLVRDDHYDWPQISRDMVAAEDDKPDLAVIMLGANDRQPIRLETGRVPVRSDEWIAAYRERIEALAKIYLDAGVPVVWVGIPPMRTRSLSQDVAFFSDLQEQVTARLNVPFVDIWDGFADENGAFVTSGPDQNGQIRQLRTSDGINFARAGREKAAFFAASEVDRLLGSEAPLIAGLGASALESAEDSSVNAAIERPKIWETVLTDDTASGLAGATIEIAGATTGLGPEVNAEAASTETPETAAAPSPDNTRTLPPVLLRNPAHQGRLDANAAAQLPETPRL